MGSDERAHPPVKVFDALRDHPPRGACETVVTFRIAYPAAVLYIDAVTSFSITLVLMARAGYLYWQVLVEGAARAGLRDSSRARCRWPFRSMSRCTGTS